MPCLPADLKADRPGLLPRKPRYGRIPELKRRGILRPHANFPETRAQAPDFRRHFRAYSAPSIPAQYEELSNIPDLFISGYLRSSLDQHKTRQLVLKSHKKRLTARIRPVEAKILITKPAVVPKLYRKELAEIINVQLKHIGENRMLIFAGGDQVETGQHATRA